MPSARSSLWWFLPLGALIIITACVWTIVRTRPPGGLTGEDWLAFEAIIVASATFASIVFAAFTYLEAVVVTKRVDEAHARLDSLQEKTVQKLERVNNRYAKNFHALAISSIKCLVKSAQMAPGMNEDFNRGLIREAQRAQIQVHLEYGDYDSIRLALELAFKYDRLGFLEVQYAALEKSEAFDSAKRADIRLYCKNLSKYILSDAARQPSNTVLPAAAGIG